MGLKCRMLTGMIKLILLRSTSWHIVISLILVRIIIFSHLIPS